MRFFNTAGPVNCQKHYCLPPLERFDMDEIEMLIAQRIINGGGQVIREYALGSKRTDLLVIWPYVNGTQRAVIELKLARAYDAKQVVLNEGLEQTEGYMARCGADEGHLVIFDRDPQKYWDEKISQHQKSYQGTNIKVWCM